MIEWSVYNFSKHYLWIDRKRAQALNAVKEAGRDCQVNGIENGLITSERHHIYACLEHISKECTKLNLNGTFQQIFTLSVEVGTPHKPCYWSDIESGLKGIQWSIDHELSMCEFAFIPPNKARFLERDADKALFGKEVYKRFKSARSEIKDAGNCLAADLNTAAVFHLMRVAELGLRALAQKTKVKIPKKPLEYAQWGDIISAIEAKLKAHVPKAVGPRRAGELEFIHGALGELKAFRDVWRNHVMHSRHSYNALQAINVFDRVGDFMRRLASRIGE